MLQLGNHGIVDIVGPNTCEQSDTINKKHRIYPKNLQRQVRANSADPDQMLQNARFTSNQTVFRCINW